MNAKILHFISPDVDLARYVSSTPEDEGIFLQMLVGPAGLPGEEAFGVFVCTPRYLMRWPYGEGPIIGRHILIVQSWNWQEISAFLTRVVESEDAPNWTELGERIGRVGSWEFEDLDRGRSKPMTGHTGADC